MVQESLVRLPSTRRAQAKQQTRLRLMDAARRLVAERGYEAATLREVAALANVSTGAVFANFADKADLFNEVIIDDAEALLLEMRRAATQSVGAGQTLLAMLTAAAAVQAKESALLQAKMGFAWASEPALEQRRRPARDRILQALADAVNAGAATGELAADVDAQLVAEMAWDGHVAGCRHLVFDGWAFEQVVAHMAARIELLLDGARISGRDDSAPRWAPAARAEAPARRALRG